MFHNIQIFGGQSWTTTSNQQNYNFAKLILKIQEQISYISNYPHIPLNMNPVKCVRNLTKLCSQSKLSDLVCAISKRSICSTGSSAVPGGRKDGEVGVGPAAEIGMNRTGKTKVLYDGECPLCIQEIKIVRYLNKEKDAIHFVDISQPGYNQLEHNNIPLDEAMGVMHVIGPDNTVYKKVDAVDAMYSAVGWGWMTGFMKWPMFAGVFDRGYLWFARNRLRLTGQQCREGNCKIPDN